MYAITHGIRIMDRKHDRTLFLYVNAYHVTVKSDKADKPIFLRTDGGATNWLDKKHAKIARALALLENAVLDAVGEPEPKVAKTLGIETNCCIATVADTEENARKYLKTMANFAGTELHHIHTEPATEDGEQPTHVYALWADCGVGEDEGPCDMLHDHFEIAWPNCPIEFVD